MDRRAFENRLKILRSIDFAELADAGVLTKSECWTAFRGDPATWLIRADDERGGRLWSLVEARAARREPAEEPPPVDLLADALEVLEDLVNPRCPDPELELLVTRIRAAVGAPAAPSGFEAAGDAAGRVVTSLGGR